VQGREVLALLKADNTEIPEGKKGRHESALRTKSARRRRELDAIESRKGKGEGRGVHPAERGGGACQESRRRQGEAILTMGGGGKRNK